MKPHGPSFLFVAISTCFVVSLPLQAGETFYYNRRGDRVVLSEIPADTPPRFRKVSYLGGPALLVTGTVGVQFLRSVSLEQQSKTLAIAGLSILRVYAHDPAFVLARVESDGDPFASAQKLFHSGLVEWAEPTMAEPIRLHAVDPNDPVYTMGVQLHLRQDLHGFPEAWEISTGSPRVTVAVIDTGIDFRHPEIEDNFRAGFDIFSESGDGSPTQKFDDDHHGTAVAGLIAAATSNGEGIAGICWDCGLLSVRLIDRQGTIYVDRSLIYDALRLAIDQGAWIINNSWGPVARDETKDCVSTPFSEFVAKGVEEAEMEGRGGLGTLVVWSAGNDSCSTELQPHLAHSLTVVVSALDGFAQFQGGYSNFGPQVTVSAVEGNFTTDIPGVDGASDGTDPYLQKFQNLEASDYLRNFRGTSAAAPVVSGALALALTANPGLSAAELRACLTETAVKDEETCPHGDWNDAGHSPCYGYGRLDAEALVKQAISGDCGGRCSKDGDCPEGTRCDLDRGICVFAQSTDTDQDQDTATDLPPDTETQVPSQNDGSPDGAAPTLQADEPHCSCRTIGA